MKKINYSFVLLFVACLFGSCAINKAPFQDYPAVTEVQLNQANFRIVGTAQGYSRQLYVFGIGGISKKSLKENAIMDMYENAKLKGAQAIVNITTASTSSQFLPFYQVVRATARGTIIEFLPENGKSIQSIKSPYNTTPERTVMTETQMQDEKNDTAAKIKSVQNNPKALKEANKHYIAWLMKTGKLSYDRKKQAELSRLFDKDELTRLRNKLTVDDLYEKSQGHDEALKRFAK